MAEIMNKENMSPVRQSPYVTKSTSKTPSPAKRKSRSKSIGPGGLDGVLEEQKKSSPDKNRRKSSFAPAVKSILPSKEDEAKRREARRKSLANRRVSFAPEATLHTWDVIEYMREATTSSSSSDNTRRASSVSRSPSSDVGSDPPSTPPEQADEAENFPESPAHQRDLHQKKRRRSSAIPPLNFNDPEEDYSSSPVSGSSPMTGSEDAEDESEDDMDDGDSTAMSLVSADPTAELTLRSDDSNNTSDSSARLDAALRQASTQAGTRGIEYDEHGDMSMEMATEEVTNAFQPWAQQSMGMGLTPMAKNLIAVQDQENVNPFSPAFRAHVGPGRPSTIAEEAEEEEDEEDMSMDITRAVGGIVGFKMPANPESSMDDDSMDFTQAVGKIYQPAPAPPAQLKSALKRRLSTTETGSPMTATITSPQKASQPQLRASKRRRSSAEVSSLGDETMELTTAIGSIGAQGNGDNTMDFTAVVGGIQPRASPVKQTRRTSMRGRRRSSLLSITSNEETMDFTMAIGGIKPSVDTLRRQSIQAPEPIEEEDEELSMDMTTPLGVVEDSSAAAEIVRPMTPRNESSPAKEEPPTTPKDQGRFKEAQDLSAKKLLTPIFEKEIETTPLRIGSAFLEVPRSIRKSPRKSLSPAKFEFQRLAGTPQKSPLQAEESSLQAVPSSVEQLKQTLSPQPPSTPVATSPSKIECPALPSPQQAVLTPKSTPKRAQAISAPSPLKTPQTPLQIDAHDAVQMSPSMSRQLRASAEKSESSPIKALTETSAHNLSASLKLMSTPRKDSGTTPLKRLKDMTPKTAPVRKMFTPRQGTTPKLRTPMTEVTTCAADAASRQLSDEFLQSLQSKVSKPQERIKLNEFLELAGIKFMDLTTTKRRYTVAPTPAKPNRSADIDMEDPVDDETVQEDAVIAGACVVPELDLYQHSCRELKRYISEGKTFLKTLETEVYDDPPHLMQAYISGNPEIKSQIDAHLRDAKTLARLQSKELWYGWRSQLLEGLEDGLHAIQKGLESDSLEMLQREELLDSMLPIAEQRQSKMQEECRMLEENVAAVSEDDQEELERSRERLLEVNQALQNRKRLLERLQLELEEQDSLAEAYVESRSEALLAIEKADHIREACRGISPAQVSELQTCVTALEESTGWSLTSASGTSVTMTYLSQLRLFFDFSAFLSDTAQSPRKSFNKPISLTYIGDADEYRSIALPTEKRFFLQLMRAHLQCLEQSQTKVPDLLSFVSAGWNVAGTVSENLRRLALENMVEISILSDEKLGAQVTLLLPKVQTKVLLNFEIGASVGEDEMKVATSVDVVSRVVYGEQYKEGSMGDFVRKRTKYAMEDAEVAVKELKTRLVITGRKVVTD